MTSLHLRYGGHPRRVRVHAPHRAAHGQEAHGHEAHPVLVLFDGQNVFGDVGSYAGGWHADAAVAKLPSTVRRPIVVAVDHGGAHRVHELWRDLDRFLDLVDEALAAVRARWPVVAGPAGVVAGGSSMGGLAALMAHFRRPQTFGGALAMSPSLWVGRGAPLRELAARPAPATSRIYLDVGERERGAMPRLAAQLAADLRHRGWHDVDGREASVAGRPAGVREHALLWRPDKRGTHHERHWRRRLPKALRFLFRR